MQSHRQHLHVCAKKDRFSISSAISWDTHIYADRVLTAFLGALIAKIRVACHGCACLSSYLANFEGHPLAPSGHHGCWEMNAACSLNEDGATAQVAAGAKHTMHARSESAVAASIRSILATKPQLFQQTPLHPPFDVDVHSLNAACYKGYYLVSVTCATPPLHHQTFAVCQYCSELDSCFFLKPEAAFLFHPTSVHSAAASTDANQSMTPDRAQFNGGTNKRGRELIDSNHGSPVISSHHVEGDGVLSDGGGSAHTFDSSVRGTAADPSASHKPEHGGTDSSPTLRGVSGNKRVRVHVDSPLMDMDTSTSANASVNGMLCVYMCI